MKLIPLTQGQFAQVDDHWYSYLMQWSWFAYRSKNMWYAALAYDVAAMKYHGEFANLNFT